MIFTYTVNPKTEGEILGKLVEEYKANDMDWESVEMLFDEVLTAYFNNLIENAIYDVLAGGEELDCLIDEAEYLLSQRRRLA